MGSLFREFEKFSNSAVVSKEWGYEVWHFNTPVLCMKTLVIYPNYTCSFHGHGKKYEIFVCLDSGGKGGLYIQVADQPERLMKRGEHVIITQGVKHSFRGIGTEPCALLEFSTHHREDDSFREWASHAVGGGDMLEFAGEIGLMKGCKIICLGDMSLDEYHAGTVRRLSPEAPVPVLALDPNSPDITQTPGCVGNVAQNVVALGGKAAIVSIIGQDQEGNDLVAMISELTMTTSYVIVSDNRPTTLKTRFITGQHHLLRVDKERTDDLDEVHEDMVKASLAQAIEEFGANVLCIADYDKGVCTPGVIQFAVEYAHKAGMAVIADPKMAHFHDYKDVDILKPNDVRAGDAMGMRVDTVSDVEALAQSIKEELMCGFVLVTRGSKGMYLFGDGWKIDSVQAEADPLMLHIPPRYVEISELSGAGDTANAALALGIGSGMPIAKAAEVANIAASIVVQKAGTACVTPTELSEALELTNVNGKSGIFEGSGAEPA